jgi:2-polyprenyl-3-methyl-5-hydroxy-6-metoxy-1,4-benzoquinol methylase
MPENVREMLLRDGEIVRLHHLVGAVPDGARVLDVGCGPVVVGGTLALHGRLEAYLGVDLSEPKIESARAMAAANDLASALRFEVGDATALPVEAVDELAPDTVLVLEVLEHLRDPASVLASIAEVVPGTARIVFSVPILGRIEACWGHRTLFGAR